MDNVLKKEFNSKDVSRLRNLITKKHNDSISTQVGYKKEVHFYDEGDIWEENGKQWTIKNGIKQNITKLDSLKKISHIPLFCPECNKVMNHTHDKKMYNIHYKCSNCVIKYETKLRHDGKYEAYEKDIINKNANFYIDNLEQEFIDFINENLTFVTEEGDVENWSQNIDKEKLLDEFNQYKNQFKDQINKTL